jgi:hypothetical protein
MQANVGGSGRIVRIVAGLAPIARAWPGARSCPAQRG